MKKLMIAAAIVCAAAFAQAATISWSITGVTDAPGSASTVDSGNYIGYIFLTGDSTWTPEVPGLNALVSLDEVLNAFAEGKYPEDVITSGISFDMVNDVTGNVVLQLEDLNVTGASSEKPITLTAMAVIFDSYNPSADVDPDTPVMANYQVLTKDFEFVKDLNPLADTSAASNDWTPAPEPTTGLLMLVGLAGLALKRKRA